MRGRAAMLKDLTKRWILELEADLLDLYFIATILDPRFKDFEFLQSKNSQTNILPAEWLAKATNCFKVEFDCLYGQLRELRCQNLLKLLLQRTLGLLFLPKKNMVLA